MLKLIANLPKNCKPLDPKTTLSALKAEADRLSEGAEHLYGVHESNLSLSVLQAQDDLQAGYLEKKQKGPLHGKWFFILVRHRDLQFKWPGGKYALTGFDQVIHDIKAYVCCVNQST